jgi:nucleotide sugar dehydrogenase
MKTISVIGVGRLGLGFALLLENIGYDVVGVDVSEEYVKKLNSKTLNTSEPAYTELLQNTKNFKATTSLEEGLNHSDLIFIIVQTPNSGGERFYDHSILSNLLININRLKPTGKDIIIGCTVMPKYIDEIGIHLISDCVDCHLSYNPEFVAQGEIIKGFKNPDIILVGTNNQLLIPKLKEVYSSMSINQPKFCFMTPIEAEIVKISLNGFITTKISYANMISDLCDELNADKTVVLNAIGSDTRIGNKYFRPGYSFGGPCFPRDTKALKLLVSQNGIVDDLLSATTKYNEYHIEYQANQLLKEDKEIYTFENVCYKENSIIPIIEESAKLKIANKLVKYGKSVIISDVNDIINKVKKEYGNRFTYEIIEPPNVQTIQTTNNVVSNMNVKINEVYNFWNDRPCNIRHSNKEIGTKEYFEEVSKRKYIVEPHIIDFANFKEYNGKDVLEVGCGIGTAAQSFIENGANYTGIDLSDRSIEIAKQRLDIFNLSGKLFQANIEELNDIENKEFDLIYSFGVLHHTPNIDVAIRNIFKMLKVGGEFKLMLYAKNSLKNFEIQDGLDQYEAQNGVPIANVYTNDEIHSILKDFKNISIKQTHIFPYKIEEYKQYVYEKKDYFKHMPQDVFDCLEKNLGWHLCITCNK